MKTAISVEDSLMEEADAAAKDLGMSRSGLICAALRDYLRARQQAMITERLNKAYALAPTEGERKLVRKLRTKLPITDKW